MVTRILCPSHVPREHTLPTQSRVLSPANCLLQETQEKARVQGLYLLTKHEHHSKSKAKPQGHCSVFFLPMSKWEVMPIPEISGNERKGVSTFFCKQRAGKRAGSNTAKGKVKIPVPLCSAAELPHSKVLPHLFWKGRVTSADEFPLHL